MQAIAKAQTNHPHCQPVSKRPSQEQHHTPQSANADDVFINKIMTKPSRNNLSGIVQSMVNNLLLHMQYNKQGGAISSVAMPVTYQPLSTLNTPSNDTIYIDENALIEKGGQLTQGRERQAKANNSLQEQLESKQQFQHQQARFSATISKEQLRK